MLVEDTLAYELSRGQTVSDAGTLLTTAPHFLFFGLCGLLMVLLGRQAVQARKHGGAAFAGLLVVGSIAMLPLLGAWRHAAEARRCLNEVRGIYSAIALSASEHEGRLRNDAQLSEFTENDRPACARCVHVVEQRDGYITVYCRGSAHAAAGLPPNTPAVP